MSSSATTSRPFGVTLVMVVIAIAAIFNLIIGTLLVFSVFGDNPTFTDPFGDTREVGGGWLIFNGAITFILGLMYLWLIKMTAIGSATAQVIIQMLAIINIVFALFNLPYGWWTMLFSLIILFLVSSARATMWFRQTN
jgi:hypothetical protein